MYEAMIGLYLSLCSRINRAMKEENGEANIIAIILIIIAVIGLAGIFSSAMEEIVGGLIQRIKNLLGL